MEIYLNFVDQSAVALDFYGKVFKTTTDEIMYYRDAPTDPEHPLPEQLKDLVMHASIMIDGTQVMISDVPPEMGLELTSGNNIALVIQAKSDAEIEQLYHDLSSDGKIVAPLEATFWAKKYAIVNDKFGIQWQLNLPTKG